MSSLCSLPVGIVPPRTKAHTGQAHSGPADVSKHNGRVPNGISRVGELLPHLRSISNILNTLFNNNNI